MIQNAPRCTAALRRVALACLVCGVSALAGGTTAHGSDTPPTVAPAAAPQVAYGKVDHVATGILARAVGTYLDLLKTGSLSEKLVFSEKRGGVVLRASTTDIAFIQPGYVRVTTTITPTTPGTEPHTITAVCDGADLYQTISTDPAHYRTQRFAKGRTAGVWLIWDSALWAASGQGNSVRTRLLAHSNWWDALTHLVPGATVSVTQIAPGTVGGVAADVIEVTFTKNKNTSTLHFAIGQKDHLFRRIVWTGTDNTGQRFALTNTYQNVTTDPDHLDQDHFHFTPLATMTLDPTLPTPYDP